MSLLSRESSQPLTEQLAQRFVTRMRDQLLVSGARLPSVRQCAQMHGVSASTVVAAYDWLVAQDSDALLGNPEALLQGFGVSLGPLEPSVGAG